jgi:hypothetical protein
VFVYWKRPGVGHDGDVERLRDLRRERHVELRKDVAQDLAGRRGVADDEVHVAEARVVVVVVDVERERGPLEQLRHRPHARLVRAVERDEHASRRVVRKLAAHVLERMKPYSRGSGASP